MPDGAATIRPMAPTLQDLVRRSAEFLTGKGIANGRREAEWIFAETLKLTRLELYTQFERPLDPPEVERLRALVTRRGKREPLAYVLGNQPFRDLVLHVGPGVLTPRPETEELVGLILKEWPEVPPRVLDVGTGSGCIALALKKSRRTATVEATDASPEALAQARGNAQRLGLEVTFHEGHLARHLAGPYALVVANLPYIGETELADCDPELAHEPREALFAGPDGLVLIRELLADIRRIAPGGILWLEHGWRQGPAIRDLCTGLGFASVLVQDGAGHDRFTRVTVSAA